MQPFAKGTKGMGFASVLLASDTVSCFSISIAIKVCVRNLSIEAKNRYPYSRQIH
jgi:hypothetical protein